jgi:23S rRNA maturation-related 3'-5' exoribonuclease YhaM
MRELKDVDWRREIESFIEMKIREKEVLKTLDAIDRALSGVEASKEPAWRTIRDFRER